MSLNDTQIASFRRVCLGLTGLCCAAYSVAATLQNRPDPTYWYIPGLAGLAAAFAIFVVFFIAGPKVIRMASDELYREVNHRAMRHAYWIGVAMYPIFGLMVAWLGLYWDTAFAAMGTANAASYLLLVTFYDWRTT